MRVTLSKRCVAASMFILSHALLTSCSGPGWWNMVTVEVAGVAGDQVWFAYQWDTDPTTSVEVLWKADLSTGRLEQVRSDVYWPAWVEGDFLVMQEYLPADDPSSNDMKGRIKTIRLSSGEETIVQEVPDAFVPACVVADGQVAVVTNQELALYDLPGNEAARTINLPPGTWWLLGFDESKALVGRACDYPASCDSSSMVASLLLVDTVTEETIDLPDPPGFDTGAVLYYTDVKLYGHNAAANLYSYTENGISSRTQETIVVLDLVTLQWQVVTEREQVFALPLDYLFFSMQFVAGVDDQHVVLLKWDAGLRGAETRIELVNTATGETQTIGRYKGMSMLLPDSSLLQDGRVFWIDPAQRMLLVYDVATGQQQTVSLVAVTEP